MEIEEDRWKSTGDETEVDWGESTRLVWLEGGPGVQWRDWRQGGPGVEWRDWCTVEGLETRRAWCTLEGMERGYGLVYRFVLA